MSFLFRFRNRVALRPNPISAVNAKIGNHSRLKLLFVGVSQDQEASLSRSANMASCLDIFAVNAVVSSCGRNMPPFQVAI